MTLLDKQMNIDLEERLNGKEIFAAREIGKAIKGDSISTKGLPSYFFGDRDAKTVVVNLNPGEAADICDACRNARTASFGTSIDGFIEKYEEIARFRPFVEMILDEIFSKERRYVIFASAKFEYIFKDYNSNENNRPGSFVFWDDHPTISSSLKESGKLRGRCSVIKMNYKGKTCNALIAHTFPSQGLSKAYDLMQKYGEFCYKTYNPFMPK